MIHFIGFRGDEFGRAQKVFGPPDFIHRHYDRRTVAMVAEGDVMIFAKGNDQEVAEFVDDDSQFF